MSAAPRSPGDRAPRSRERGVALVMAIVVLLVVTILGTMLIQSLSTERKISGHGMRASRALSTAEAGVAEATSRIRSREIELDESVPQSAAQLFLAAAGALPAVGADTTAYASLQPVSGRLEYSTAGRGPNVLTIGFRRDARTGAIVRYDPALQPPYNTSTGMAVVQVRATGIVGADRARVLAEVVPPPLHSTLNAAITAHVPVTLGGGFGVCGYQHSAVTPFGDGQAGRLSSPGCTADEVGRGDVPAVWSAGTVTNSGATLAGSPAATIEGETSFFSGPQEALGLTSAQLATVLGTPVASAPVSVSGVVWLDDNTTAGDRAGSYSVADLHGTGFLYVDGDLTLSGTTQFRGLVYVEGNFSSTAGGQVVGALVVRGRTGGTCSLAAGPSVVYSRDAVNAPVARALGSLVTLSWREVR